MHATPLFLGACALASIAGAVGGAAINTDPIQRAGIGSEMIARPAIAFDPTDAGLLPVALPDHYAMDTPEGRIEAAELSARGLYSRSARQFAGQGAAGYPIEPLPEPASLEPQLATDQERSVPDSEAEETPEFALASEPLVSTETRGDGPRSIDVTAVLAARR